MNEYNSITDMNEKLKSLEGKGKESFTGIPEYYFENLPEKIFDKVRHPEIKNGKYYMRPFIITLAASLLIIFGLTIILLYQSGTDNYKTITAESDKEFLLKFQEEELMMEDTPAGDVENDSALENDLAFTDNELADVFDNLFAGLDKLPADVIADYLNEVDEFGF